MRCYVPITIAILIGAFASQGRCCQITSLPPLTSAENEKAEESPRFKSSPVVEAATQVAGKANQTDQSDLDAFNRTFESALSQFPQHRIARLPLTPQQPATFSAGPQFQDIPTIRSLPITDSKAQSVIEPAPAENGPSLLNQFMEPDRFKKASTITKQEELEIELPPQSADTPLIVESNQVDELLSPEQEFGYAPTEQFRPGLSSTEPWVAPQPAPMAPMPIPVKQPQPQFGSTASPVFPTAPTQMAPVNNSGLGFSNESLTWWKDTVLKPLDGTRPTESVDSNMLVYRTLQNSPRIQAVSQNPLIRELQIVEADAEFDATQYVRSQFEDRNDPVGNSLTVGTGESFLKDNIWSADLGLSKKARNGATWELNQRLGFQNSNSNFFVPQDQGTATLALNVTQPLLRGRGTYYNQSQILIAQATNGAAWQTFHAELQDELLGVVSAYWDLYLSRSIYLQKRRNVERGARILDRLEGRAGLDSLPSQIARARSSVQTRRTELANALRDVRNSETEVRRRIADNSWMNGGGSELIPGELPTAETFRLPLEQVVYGALKHRPEVHEAMGRARIAAVQRDVSANELMPELSLLLGSYVSSLRGDTGILNAFQDQFGQVKPGYSVGINFELPYRNRAARSRLAQRKLQVKKIKHEVDEVMQNVIAESQVALRRVESASETLVAATEAIRAAHADRNQFEKRWESFALVEGDLADGQNPTTVLDQLLDSQDRLASAELVYVQAERELKVSEVSLQRAMGTLLMRQNVSTSRGIDCEVPRMNIMKDGTALIQGTAGMPAGSFQPGTTVAPTNYVDQPQQGEFIAPQGIEMSIPAAGQGWRP